MGKRGGSNLLQKLELRGEDEKPCSTTAEQKHFGGFKLVIMTSSFYNRKVARLTRFTMCVDIAEHDLFQKKVGLSKTLASPAPTMLGRIGVTAN